MSDAVTQAVLWDVYAIAVLALTLALVLYSTLRRAGDSRWNLEGNVLSRPYAVVDVLVALGLLALLAWGGMQGQDGGAGVDETPEPISALGLFFSALLLLFMSSLLLLYMQIYRGLNPAEMFGLRHLKAPAAFGWAVLWIIVVVLAMGACLYLATQAGLGWKGLEDTPQETVKIFQSSGGLVTKGLLAVLAVVIAPLSEEIFFRGFLYGVIKRYTDRWFATLFSALVFAAVHQHLGSLGPLFLLAIGFAVAYEATGSLLVPVFMHALFNGGNLVALTLRSGQ